MKQTDFRIGNTVAYNTANYTSTKRKGDTTVIEEIGTGLIMTVPTTDLLGIRLTRKLLKSKGFRVDEKCFWYFLDKKEGLEYMLDFHNEKHSKCTVFIRNIDLADDWLALCYIKHYHQWENLFYMISSREFLANG